MPERVERPQCLDTPVRDWGFPDGPDHAEHVRLYTLDLERRLAAVTAERNRLWEAADSAYNRAAKFSTESAATPMRLGALIDAMLSDLRNALTPPADQPRCNECGRVLSASHPCMCVGDSGAEHDEADQPAPDISKCPACDGPADQGHSRDVPPLPYECSQCNPEQPVPATRSPLRQPFTPGVVIDNTPRSIQPPKIGSGSLPKPAPATKACRHAWHESSRGPDRCPKCGEAHGEALERYRSRVPGEEGG